MSESAADGATGRRHSHGWPEKREAIDSAALEIFLRDGFARASVADIAAVAGVSKRTLYKHAGDKEELFLIVLADALADVRRRFADVAAEHLDGVTDLESSLVAFGRAWVRLAPELVALRRLHVAEAGQFPSLVESWRTDGAKAIHHVLEHHLRRLHEQGLLRTPDVTLAGHHLAAFLLYSADERALFDFAPVPEEDLDQYVRNAVDAFLDLYGADRRRAALGQL